MDPSMAAGLTVYTLPVSPPLLDGVGVFFITYAVTWSTLVFAAMAFCWRNRRLPILKIRGLPLSFAAILCLHSYWIMSTLVYPVGRAIPIVIAYDVQYMVMGTYFPAGIALFHASNCRFLHVAKMQKQFTHPALRRKAACKGIETSWLCRVANMPYATRFMTLIAIGLVFQISLTLGLWFACRKYHPTFGIPGTEIRGASLPEQIIDLGRGWEWIPTVLWQVIWSWIVAPILLWRSWGIRDTMGWRTQTIGCCLLSLHAAPMFLIASYVSAFDKINAYFPPSQWIHLSTMFFEVFAVFLPAFQVIRLRILTSKAVSINAKWDTESRQSTLRESTSYETRNASSLAMAEKGGVLDYMDEELGDRLLTMGALDYVLHENPGPLQEFSALNDFSGENVAFLTLVASWKASWPASGGDAERLDAYRRALAIYIDLISPRDAEFPLNLASSELKFFEHMFEEAARIVNGEGRVDSVSPFSDEAPYFPGRDAVAPPPGSNSSAEQYAGPVPVDFDAAIFDRAQRDIKYLVLTNTWPKFVAEMQRRRRSTETSRSVFSATSQETLASRMTKRVRQLLSTVSAA